MDELSWLCTQYPGGKAPFEGSARDKFITPDQNTTSLRLAVKTWAEDGHCGSQGTVYTVQSTPSNKPAISLE